MSDHVESVKRVIDDLRSWAEKNRESGKNGVAERMEGLAGQLDEVMVEMVRLYGLTSALPPDLGNIYDLPAELRGELSVAKTDELEDQLVTVINSYGGEATLDQILVGLFRKFKVIQKRRFLQNKLYRMPMIWSVDGKKGAYTTRDPELLLGYDKTTQNTETYDDYSEEIPF